MNPAVLLCMVALVGQSEPPCDFDTEVIPVLSRAGCNAGACHGAAAGRGGFHLSLLGSDAAADYDSIAKAFEGRRINLARPELSLLLAKPTGQLDHGGDVVLQEGSAAHLKLLAWIKAGAPRGSPRPLTQLRITPRRIVVNSLPADVPLQAMARFANEAEIDVTATTLFTSSDPDAVHIDLETSVARVTRRGQHLVIARFLDRVVPIQITVPLSDSAVDLSQEPQANFIDEEIIEVLSELHLPPSPLADDATYLRRLSLDLTGRLPEPEQVERYLSDTDSDKRAKLVDQLLSSSAFTDYWTLRMARLLRIHSLPHESAGVEAYSTWLREQIRDGSSLADMAYELLTASGDAHEIGPANFGRMVGDARNHAELVGQYFLGVRIGCANCHNHPLDKWTQEDYHGLAAVFARLERGRYVRWSARGAVTNPRTGEPAIPRIPGEYNLDDTGDHRVEFARWLTGSGKYYFARATVNRLWRAMFGRGLVEPTDDLRETNPATHPELLERLAQDFIASGYNVRHTLRLIALSRTYARSTDALSGNAVDDRFYSRAYRRPLVPEVLADAIADVTGVANEFAQQPEGTRAVRLLDSLAPAPALDILGRCTRTAGCDESSSAAAGMATQLHLINGELINGKLVDPNGRLHRQIDAGKSNTEIVKELYIRALVRAPTRDELIRWDERLAASSADERARRLEDFLWSLLNSPQFTNNQ